MEGGRRGLEKRKLFSEVGSRPAMSSHELMTSGESRRRDRGSARGVRVRRGGGVVGKWWWWEGGWGSRERRP